MVQLNLLKLKRNRKFYIAKAQPQIAQTCKIIVAGSPITMSTVLLTIGKQFIAKKRN